ncbi:hypothetical protein BHE74_00033238 [Ensete ventricosum]|nr:hypothetical protein BHE74_00033238 [Ensete ventricosum]
MQLGTRLECIGSSPRVSGVCQDGAREFARRRSRLAGRLTGVAERLTRSWEEITSSLESARVLTHPFYQRHMVAGVALTHPYPQSIKGSLVFSHPYLALRS